jgi:hypothetical protein
MVLLANVPMASRFSGFSVFFFLHGYIIGFLGRGIGPSQDLLSYKDRNKQEIADTFTPLVGYEKSLSER